MNIGKIIKNSLRYPFQDWKKIFLLGIILLISSTLVDLAVFAQNNIETGLLVIIGLILVLVVYGYSLRIIKSSQTGGMKLPPFNKWGNMLISGVKVLIVGIVYFIPVILVIILTAFLYPSNISSIFEGIGLNPLAVTGSLIESIMIQGVGNLIPILFTFTDTTIVDLIALIYIVIIIPLLLMAIATMVDDNKLNAAFKFRKIIDKIRVIGFDNFIEWYVLTGILYLIIFAVVNIFYYYVGPLMLLILIPYFYIYQSRSIAQLYKLDKELL
jgi:hypothetical protein